MRQLSQLSEFIKDLI